MFPLTCSSASHASVRLPVGTTTAFAGNPAGVCLLPHRHSWSDVDASWMQSVALEMNQAETAFLIRSTPPTTTSTSSTATVRYLLRWFTPAAEVDLCGHATLASSYLLFTTQVERSQTIEFDTRSGILTARALPLSANGDMSASASTSALLIELDLPSDTPTALPQSSDEYKQLLPILTSAFSSTSPAILSIHRGKYDYLVELSSPDQISLLTPTFTTLARITTRGIAATARADDTPYTFVSSLHPHSASTRTRYVAVRTVCWPWTGVSGWVGTRWWGGRRVRGAVRCVWCVQASE